MRNLLYTVFAMFVTLVTACQQRTTSNTTEHTSVEHMDTLSLLSDTTLVTDTAGLEDNLWLLQELNGQAIEISEKQEAPSIMFRSDDQKFISKTDCNGISGDYQLGRADSLQLLQLFHTEMACENMEVEKGLLEHLPHVRSYQIEGGQLILLDEHGVAVVRLQWSK